MCEMRVNPSPILNLSTSELCCDIDCGLFGNSCSFFNDVSGHPLGLGRMCPAVCKLSDGRIFYCGGVHSSQQSGLVESTELRRSQRISQVTAFFSVKLRRWEQVSDMPWGVLGAVACQIGNHILVIGGERNRVISYAEFEHFSSQTVYTQSVQCFDLITNKWLPEHGYKDKLLSGSSSIAVATLPDGKIIAAGGNYIYDAHHEYGPLVTNHTGMEVLDPETKTWTVLPGVLHDELETGRGIVLSNGQFSVLTQRHFCSYNMSDGTWEQLESPGMKSEVSSVVRVGAFTILAISCAEAKVYYERVRRWFSLPFRKVLWGGILVRDKGDSFSVFLANTIAISINH